MIPEIGTLALIIALLLALAQTVFGLAGAQLNRPSWIAATTPAVAGVWVFVTVAFVALAYSLATHDFSVTYVATNSNSELPLLYRIAATWGAHEGSLLLWIELLATWALLVAALSGQLPVAFRARVLGVLGLVGVGFLAFTLFTSSPFARLSPAAIEGADLNPLLQDPALAAHPPMLYMGYVGTSVAFAFAVAAMLSGRLDAQWARWTRPWVVAAWMSLTIGIALGSWWAYYVLGWGGWWFWDPVENASFMPWLAATALLHSLAVTEKRGLFKSWTLLLAIFAFSLSLLGTFLVRSGVLVSVHAFASDPSRGMFILALLLFFIVGSLTLYAVRAPGLKSEGGFELVSREAFLLLNNALLVTAALLILTGELWPLAMDAFDLGKISVGPPYYNAVFLVPGIPLVFLLAIGMHAGWRRGLLSSRRRVLAMLFGGALLLALLLAFGAYRSAGTALTIVAFTAGLFVMGSALIEPVEAWRRGQKLPRAAIGMAIAHFGVGVWILGVTGVVSYKVEKDVSLAPGESTTIAGYTFKYLGTKPVSGPNYEAIEARVVISEGDRVIAELPTQKRVYRVQKNPMTHAGISVAWNRDLFVALGDDLGGGKWSMRLQYKPLVRYIWLGAVIMACGGLVAILDRRYRVRRTADAAVADGAAAAEAG
ncbi:MAG: heme lyase CcmF/NrfE family subunit [Proteobacteria bacterium]|nr:heme lyase CcmF/NrfE family subunit [Pseudomonadota bacterium]